MGLIFGQDILCPTLIGRGAQIAALNYSIEQGAAGQGQVILLSGEAGIGKSRLVVKVKTLTHQLGFTNLQGNCFEPDRALPYAPIIDLIRTTLRDHPLGQDLTASALRPFIPELLKLLPELALHFPDVDPAPVLESGQQRRLHFQLLTQLINKLGTLLHRSDSNLQLIVIEDLHWCDDTSLDFLLHLARQAASQPMVLLLTHRSDEETPALQHFLSELQRARLANELSLDRLTSVNVADMIRAIFTQADPVRAEFTDAIFGLTEGNPFFVEEILKSLVASGDIFHQAGGWTRRPLDELHIPRTLQEAVQRRTDQLSDPARNLLSLAAVAGRRFDVALLQHTSRLSEEDLLRLIKELMEAQLVVEESADHFSFRHALTRQIIYTGLLGRERRALHKKIAETLESLHGDSNNAELALHTYEAELWSKAVTASRHAGEHAESLYTPRAAIEHYTRAILAAGHLLEGTPIELYRIRGQQYQTLGELDRAEADYQTMLDEARRRTNTQAEWQALMDLGFLWAARDYNRTGDYFQRALGLVHSLTGTATLAHTFNRVGNWHLNLDHTREALRYHHEALRIFESLNDQPGLASTHDLLGITYYASNDVHKGIAHYEQAMSRFRTLGDWGGLASSLVIYASRGGEYIASTAVPMRTAMAERLRAAEEALALARKTDARPAETLTTLWLGMNLSSNGNYNGLIHVRSGLEMAEAINHQHFCIVGHMISGMCYMDVLSAGRARDHLARALALAHATHSGIWIGTVTAYLAQALIYLGDLALAQKTLQDVLTPETPFESMGQCQLWAVWAELLLAQGNPSEALQLVERQIAASPNVEQEGEYRNPRLNRLRGEALIALRRYASAEKALHGALQTATALQLAPQQWRLWSSLSRLYRAQGNTTLADEAGTSAQQIVSTLATTLNDTALRGNFEMAASAQWLGRVAASPRKAAKQQFGGLTARERQVAILLAQGKSNLEIAEALTLSHRTVEAHISNILSKLSFSSRAQIAVWVVQRGLGK